MKSKPGEISIHDFTYDLPDERIARHPLANRDQSKLLVYKSGNISESRFADLPSEIPAQALMVFNNTRVVRARLQLKRVSGAAVEIFCTDAAGSTVDFVKQLQTKATVDVLAFVGNGKRWKDGEKLELVFADGKTVLFAERIGQSGDQFIIRLSWTPADFTFAEILDAAGKIPLPPYLGREEELDDSERYQTVYAKQEGSVAAPTAGLHFTDNLLQRLREKEISFAELALHVGAGTFKPVKADTMADHEMHREQIIISAAVIDALIDPKQKPVIAVGTTALRSLESIYWFGRQLVLNPGRHFDSVFVGQWEPYEESTEVPVLVALRAVKDWLREGKKAEAVGYTQLLIAPGYQFKMVDALITNFHQPQSTLLLLVAAFIGEDFRKVYDYALANDFRFLSYGDGSLLWR